MQKQQTVLRRGGKNIQKNYIKKIFMTQITIACKSMGLQSQRPLSEFHFLNTFTFLI